MFRNFTDAVGSSDSGSFPLAVSYCSYYALHTSDLLEAHQPID